MNYKRIKPTNRVSVGGDNTARVRRCGRRKQGGAWVPRYEVTYDSNGAIRTVGPDLIRRALKVV